MQQLQHRDSQLLKNFFSSLRRKINLKNSWWEVGKRGDGDQKIQTCSCSVAKLCLTLCDSMDCSRPGFPCPLPLPGGSVVKNPPANAGDTGVSGLIPASEDPLEQQHTLVFLPRKFHGQRSLVGCSPWGYKKLDTTNFWSSSHLYMTT